MGLALDMAEMVCAMLRIGRGLLRSYCIELRRSTCVRPLVLAGLDRSFVFMC